MNRTFSPRVTTVILLTAAITLATVRPAEADVRLPKVFGNNMVLERDVALPVWGWAEPGEDVTVAVGENKATAKADDKGKWMTKLAAMPAGGPHKLVVTGKNTVTVENVLVGEVWVCSGQSNMEWPMQSTLDAEKELAAAKFPNIRLFQVPKVPAGTPQPDVDAAWVECTPQSVVGFSAVAYFFGRDLHQQLNVPVGLIETAWGGTRIEPWTPPVGFEQVPKVASFAKTVEEQRAQYRASSVAALQQFPQWLALAQKAAESGAEIPAPPAWPSDPVATRVSPTGIYNGMVHGLVPFAIRGAIWYQGESNRGDGMQYHEYMKALIAGWRSVWGQGDFPFLFVQLAPFKYGGSDTALAEIWEAQTATLAVPNTGMVVITDVGNLQDIHPTNKQEVGKRLAMWAMATTYGKKDLVYSGPLFKLHAVEGNKVRMTFDHVGTGLASRDGKPLTWFTIAGADGKFVEAKADIDGNTVVVSSDTVPVPAAVRFGWREDAQPNLINKEGLPASPFRTDHP